MDEDTIREIKAITTAKIAAKVRADLQRVAERQIEAMIASLSAQLETYVDQATADQVIEVRIKKTK